MNRGNAWQSRFSQVTDREEIRRAAAVTPSPLKGLERLPIEAAQDVLRTTLEELFVVSDQVLGILQLHVNRARAFCERVYPSEQAYIQRLFTPDWPRSNESAILLTGLAGCGKSQLALAILRVLPVDSEIFVGGAVQRMMPLEASAYVSFRSQATPRDALAPWLPEDAQVQAFAPDQGAKRKRPMLSDSRVIEIVGFEFYLRGIVSAIGDEYQFVTQSEGANAKLARVLLALVYLGVPITNILNYSACHKLARRPQEERDRLLGSIIHIAPDLPDSSDWKLLLTAYDTLLEKVLAFRMTDKLEAIWGLTAASKRTLRRLISTGYRVAREDGRTQIELYDLERVFRSLEFCAMRSDVESTLDMLVRGAPPKGRQDLWCPFGGNDWCRLVPEAGTPQSTEAKIAAAFTEESLSADQKQELARLRSASSKRNAEPRGRSGTRGCKSMDGSTLLRNSEVHKANLKR